jgi:hypothetical protein
VDSIWALDDPVDEDWTAAYDSLRLASEAQTTPKDFDGAGEALGAAVDNVGRREGL